MKVRALTLAIAVSGTALLGMAVPAGATPAPSDPALALIAQPPAVALGTDFGYTVRAERLPQNPAIRTTVYDRLTTRSAFDRSLDGENLGAAISRVVSPLAAGDVAVTVPLVGSPTEGPALNVSQSGVYPVRVEIMSGSAPTTAAFTTYLITTPPDTPPVGEVLTVAPIVPLVAEPAYRADGQPEPQAIAAREPTGRLGRIATGLGRNPTAPVTLDLAGETVESWSRLARNNSAIAGTFNQLRAVGTPTQRFANAFVPIDAPSLRDAGFESTVRDEFAGGFDAVSRALDVRLDARTARPDPVDGGVLDELAARGIDQLVLNPASLRPLEARLTPARPFLVEGSARQFRAVATDPGLARAATGPDGPRANAQHVLAGLALVALEAPNVKRGIALALPGDLDTDPAFFDALFTGLQTLPYVRSTTLDGLFTDVPLDATTAGPLVRTLAPTELRPPNITQAELDRSRQRNDALQTLVAPTDDRAIQARNALLIAPTSLWVGTEGRRRAGDELTAVEGSLKQAATAIRAPTNRTFQLTGKKDRIPLTFINDSDVAVDIRIRLDGTRIAFPNGNEQTVRLLPRRSTTVQVAVEPRTSGTYPFTLTMFTTAGSYQLAKSRLTVNASAVSGVGMFVAFGAGLFLVAWWSHYIWKRRKRPKSPTPVPDAATEPEEQTA